MSKLSAVIGFLSGICINKQIGFIKSALMPVLSLAFLPEHNNLAQDKIEYQHYNVREHFAEELVKLVVNTRQVHQQEHYYQIHHQCNHSRSVEHQRFPQNFAESICLASENVDSVGKESKCDRKYPRNDYGQGGIALYAKA